MRKLKHEPPAPLDALKDMSPAAREHFMELIDLLLLCYTDPPEASAVLLVQPNEATHLAIASANASDIQVAEMVREATVAMTNVIVADAPPKELFN